MRRNRKPEHGRNCGPDCALTHNQHVVRDVLANAGKPLSAYEILEVDEVRSRGLSAPVTIYRALERLIALGHAHRIECLNAFIACGHGHAHEHAPAAFMICARCKATKELAMGRTIEPLAERAAAGGFRVERVSVELLGLCARCRPHER